MKRNTHIQNIWTYIIDFCGCIFILEFEDIAFVCSFSKYLPFSFLRYYLFYFDY